MEVVRRGLVARLDAPFVLVIVEAMPGAGRSTLLRQWVSAAPGRVLVDCRDLVPGAYGDAVARTNAAVIETALRQQQPVPVSARTLSAASDLTAAAAVLSDTLRDAPWLQALVVDGLEEPAEVIIASALQLRSARPDLKLVAGTSDASGLLAAAREVGFSTDVLRDSDVTLAVDEVSELVAWHLPDAVPDAGERLWSVSGGYGAIVQAAIDAAPEQVAAGALSGADALQLWWPVQPGFTRVTPFLRTVASLVAFPRFSAALAREVCEYEDLDEHLARLLGMGLIAVDPSSVTGVLRYEWDPTQRREIDQRITASLPAAPARHRVESTVAVALRHRDWSLAATALIAAGEHEQAERLARERWWELLNVTEPALWRPMLSLPQRTFDHWPHLNLLSITFSRQGIAPTLQADAALAAAARSALRGDVADPIRRLSLLARVAHLASEADDLATADDAASRWLELVDLVGSRVAEKAPAAVIASALVVAQVLLKLDRYESADVVCRDVIAMLDGDIEQVADPDGERRFAAMRTMVMIARLGGEEVDDLLGDPLESASVRSRRSIDWATRGVSRALAAMDAGNLYEARRQSGAAMELVRRQERWPVLVLVHLWALVAVGDRDGLAALQRLTDGEAWRRRYPAASAVRPVPALVRLILEQALGLPLTPRHEAEVEGESFLPLLLAAASAAAVAEAGWALRATSQELITPRAAELLAVLEALRALRAQEPALAATALSRLAATRGVPIALALGTRAEVEQLAILAREVLPAEAADWVTLALGYRGIEEPRAVRLVLSEREHELLAHIRAARSNGEIARTLFVTVNTVKFHRSNLYRKLGARSREELLTAALKAGLQSEHLPPPRWGRGGGWVC